MDSGVSLKWRPVDVEVLSPDAAVLDAAVALAVFGRWSRLGYDGSTLWGECRGSSRRPHLLYRVAADQRPDRPTAAVLHCSCPSRKRPCKHVLGLLLLAGLERFESGAPGADPIEWVRAARPETSRVISKGREGEPPAPPVGQPAVRKGGGRRAASRDEKVRAGLAELERWLSDLISRGVAGLFATPGAFRGECERMASQLVTSQAPGLARRLRRLEMILRAPDGTLTPDWSERLLEEFAVLQLAVESFRSIHTLEEAAQADLRTLIGWSRRSEEALATRGVPDRWLVMGSILERDPPLSITRTWLAGLKTGRSALLIDYGSDPEQALQPGVVLTGELHFFPGAAPLRAVPGSVIRHGRRGEVAPDGVEAALRRFAVTLAGNPWLDLYPMFLASVVPARIGERWMVVDRQQAALPLAAESRPVATGWRLLAVGGAEPLDLFGEWDGRGFRPLTAFKGRSPIVIPT